MHGRRGCRAVHDPGRRTSVARRRQHVPVPRQEERQPRHDECPMELLQSASATLILVAACGSPAMMSGDDVDAPDAGSATSQPDAPTTTATTCDGKTTQPLDATWNIAVGSA